VMALITSAMVKIMKVFIVQFSPFSCHFFSLCLDIHSTPYLKHSSNRVEIRHVTFCEQPMDDTSLLSR
jgi:hypothetical protein